MVSYTIGKGGQEIDEKLRAIRLRLRYDILEEIGYGCESCEKNGWTDINEVLVLRNDVPKKRQLEIMIRVNCNALCRSCHKAFHSRRDSRRDIVRRHLARMDQLGYDADTFLAAYGMTREGILDK